MEIIVASGVRDLGAGEWGVETEGISSGEDLVFDFVDWGGGGESQPHPPRHPERGPACGGRGASGGGREGTHQPIIFLERCASGKAGAPRGQSLQPPLASGSSEKAGEHCATSQVTPDLGL